MNSNSIPVQQKLSSSIKTVTNFKKIPPIILRHPVPIVGISCVVISLTTMFAITTKQIYQSSMQILISYKLDQSVTNNSDKQKLELSKESRLKNIDNHINYDSQMKLMLSDKLLQKAVSLLKKDYPNITIQDINGQNKTGQKSSLELYKLVNNSSNDQDLSQVFVLSFQDRDPLKTKRILQALQKVYQDYNTEQKNQRVNQGLAFINHHLPKLQDDLIKAEEKLQKFRKNNNLIDPVLQSQILLKSLGDIQKQRQTIKAQIKDIESRTQNLGQAISSSTKLNNIVVNSVTGSDDSQYRNLVNEIKKTEQELARFRVLYTETHPIIQQLKQRQTVINKLLAEYSNQNTNKANNQPQLAKISSQLEQELTQLKIKYSGLIANDNALGSSEEEIKKQLDNYPSLIAEYKALISEVETHRKTRDQLLQVQNFLGVKIAQEGFDWQILTEPDLGISIGHRRWLIIIGGIFSGPILGVTFLWLWEKLNQKILSLQELQQVTHLRLLGSVPKLVNHQSVSQTKLPFIWGNKDTSNAKSVAISKLQNLKELPKHQSLDIIYQNIQILNNCLPLKSIMLTSSVPGEGKTTLALGLGASAANMHQRVLLIDANLRSPSLHKTLDLSNDWGLSLLLVDDIYTPLDNYIQPIHPAIDVLTAGPISEDVVNLLSSQRMKELIAVFESKYDLVLIDAPSVLDTVDGRIIARLCHSIVMVGRIGKVSPEQLREATEVLSQLNLLGIVGNEFYL